MLELGRCLLHAWTLAPTLLRYCRRRLGLADRKFNSSISRYIEVLSKIRPNLYPITAGSCSYTCAYISS